MALIRIDSCPSTTRLTAPLFLVVPDPGSLRQHPLANRKVLTLLHGLSDDASAWQRFTSIETLAAAYGLVVVMPSVGRSFYIDQPNGQAYFSYITDELPRTLKDLFGLQPARQDNFIAGNSMGGYGAIKAALLHPERYAAAASFSGVLTLNVLPLDPDDARRLEFGHLFGDLQQLPGSEHDPATWLARAALEPAAQPHLHLYVGRQEDLYPLTGMFHHACQAAGLTCEYTEDDGHHDWILWDRQLRHFLGALLGPLPGQ